MAKYDPLRDYLAQRPAEMAEVAMTFGQVEALVGELPDSARKHRAWWANDSKVEAQAWRAAGWRVSAVDQVAERVVFARGVTGGSRLARLAGRRKDDTVLEVAVPPGTSVASGTSDTEANRRVN